MNEKKTNKQLVSYITLAVSLLVIVLLEYKFFANVMFNGVLIGDEGDARLNNLLVEHWFRAFGGKEKFSIVNIFYPITNTLAYTDMLLALAIPYSILRLFGMNMFLANKIVLIGFHIFGSYSLFYLLKKKFKLNNLWSLLGVIVFSYSSAYYVRIGHTQLITISLVPLLIIFMFCFFENFQNKVKRIVYGFLTITLYVLIMYTSWYTAFFTALFMATFIVIYVCVASSNKNKVFSNVWMYIKKCYKEIIAYVVYAICIAIPFFNMYIQVSRMYGKRSYSEIATMLPELIDFFNVGDNNLLIGRFIKALGLSSRTYLNQGEMSVGFSLLTMGLLVAAFFYVRKKYLKEKYKALETEGSYTVQSKMVLVSIIYAVLVSFILLVQSNEISFWYLVYRFVPGGSAIRAAVRYNYYLVMPVAIVIANFGQMLQNRIKKEKVNLIFGIVMPLCAAALVWVSNYNTQGVYAHWNMESENKFIEAVSAPPDDCEVMYIVDSKYEDRKYAFHSYQLMAWEVSYKYNLKNMNGYSGQFPKEWELDNVWEKDIHTKAAEWIKLNKIDKNVYYYDVATNVWTKAN